MGAIIMPNQQMLNILLNSQFIHTQNPNLLCGSAREVATKTNTRY